MRAVVGQRADRLAVLDDSRLRACAGAQRARSKCLCGYSDGYLAIALVAALAVTIIAFLKPMRIYFDSTSASQQKVEEHAT